MEQWERIKNDPVDDDPGNREAILSSQAVSARFERQHGMSSAQMRRRMDEREAEETHDICKWLMEILWLDDLLETRR